MDEVDEPTAARDPVGDRDEQFTDFVDAAGAYLLHTAELLCGDRARAQDLVQATFERTYRSRRAGARWAGSPRARAGRGAGTRMDRATS